MPAGSARNAANPAKYSSALSASASLRGLGALHEPRLVATRGREFVIDPVPGLERRQWPNRDDELDNPLELGPAGVLAVHRDIAHRSSTHPDV